MIAGFGQRLLHWYDDHGRHDLPWQSPRTPYRVWVAEIMLQQTQVATVIPYYARFVARFADLPMLAAASEDEVLAHWSGLGYYSRARNLHRAARLCVEQHAGELPCTPEQLAALPGIGRSTAAAILAQAHDAPHAILDGNVKRVLTRLFGIDGWPGQPAVEKRLWTIAERLLPDARLADYTQAMMDFGATLCTRHRPACDRCPFTDACIALRDERTAELPSPRPTRQIPQRHCVMLLLENDRGEVLLERRGPTGVWAGLWSLPQFDDLDDAADWSRRHHAIACDRVVAPIDHAFSHYRLRIQPLHGHAQAPVHVRDDGNARWVSRDALSALGIPAPVRKLLETHLAA